MTIYYYKLTVDDGGAPCVEKGLLSLAICKPVIRRKAARDDVIFGFAANSLARDNPLIYIAVVTEAVPGVEYYDPNHQYRSRADCIYRRLADGHFEWSRGSIYHTGPGNLQHDLGAPPKYTNAQVLVSDNFRYFGKSGNADYHDCIKMALRRLTQGHRVNHSEELRRELEALRQTTWERYPHTMRCGEPWSTPQSERSHRGGASCECN
jgi:hypothetical protein